MQKNSSVKKLKTTAILTRMAMLAAISIILVALIHFPIFVSAPFLEYDPADIPIIIGTFLYGPTLGFILAVVTCIVQGVTVSAASGIIGIVMHIFATGSYVLVAGIIYKKNHTKKGAIIALIAGTLTMTISMVIWNLVFTPIFLGTPFDAVKAMIIPIIIPFNLIKAGVNSVITYFTYKPVERILKVKGKS